MLTYVNGFLFNLYPVTPMKLPSPINTKPGTWTSEERQARNQAPPILSRGLPWRAESDLGPMGNLGLSWAVHLSGIEVDSVDILQSYSTNDFFRDLTRFDMI